MATTQTTSGPTTRRRRRGRWVAALFGVLALAAAVAMSIVARAPTFGVAAATGLLLVLAIVGIARLRKRWWAIIGAVAVLGGAVAVGSTLLYNDRCCPNAAPPSLVVDYHASGRLTGDTITLDETVVLGPAVMSAIARSVGAGEPVTSLTGWQAGGPVNGQPSLTRTRAIGWDHTSLLADSARIPLNFGTLTAASGSGNFSASVAPASGSRLDIVLPKGATGSTSPALASRTDGLSGSGEETITVAVDRYVSDVSFDVLREPLRNPAGHAVYEASLWGFWQWVAGAVGAVVSGLIIDKVGQALWHVLTVLFRRRRVAATP